MLFCPTLSLTGRKGHDQIRARMGLSNIYGPSRTQAPPTRGPEPGLTHQCTGTSPRTQSHSPLGRHSLKTSWVLALATSRQTPISRLLQSYSLPGQDPTHPPAGQNQPWDNLGPTPAH